MAQHLVSGSYERFVFAHKVPTSTLGLEQDATLEKAFAFPAHKGPVKCLAASAPFIASGGADNTVHVYNAKASKDLGFLMNPGEGAITAVAFYTPLDSSRGPTHLLSGSADGCIAVWAVESDWDCVKTLKGHKKEVTGLSVHPTGLLALSTSRDDMLRMWNMAKGRSQYKTKIAPGTEAVSFSPDGSTYALLSGTKAYAHDVAAEGVSTAGVELQSRGMSMSFLSQQVIAIGCEDGCLQLLDTRSGLVEHRIEKAHSSRIRGMAAVSVLGQSEGADSACVGSASSDGAVKLWDLRSTGAPGRSSEPLCSASTAARLTCLATLDLSSKPDEKQSKARKAARKAKPQSDGPHEAISNGHEKADGTDSLRAPQSLKAAKGKLRVNRSEGDAGSAAAESSKQGSEGAGLDSLPGGTKQKVQGTGAPSLTREQTEAKQESLKQAELKRKKREELQAAAEAEKSGVVVRKEAETVVEFPEVSRPAKSTKKAKRHKGK